jgi:hypothetical protein
MLQTSIVNEGNALRALMKSAVAAEAMERLAREAHGLADAEDRMQYLQEQVLLRAWLGSGHHFLA